jgi:site-specific DNA-methyltransferase (adenine-specific)
MAAGHSAEQVSFPTNYEKPPYEPDKMAGRWPSNVLLSDPELFDEPNPEVVGSGATATTNSTGTKDLADYPGSGVTDFTGSNKPRGYEQDSGGYSRFFIVPKADRSDREPVLRGQLDIDGDRVLISGSSGRTLRDGEWIETHSEPRKRANHHPTVKPTDLMRHLIRLVTPAGGVVLDPFLGSGSTAIAAELEGFEWIGIEKEAEYVAIAEARLNGTQRGLGLDVPAPTSSYRPPAKMPAVKYEDSGLGKLEWFGNKPEEAA